MKAPPPRKLFQPLLTTGRLRWVNRAETFFAGQILPALLLEPGTQEELQAVIQGAFKHRIPLVPLGGNTQPPPGESWESCVLLSTHRLNKLVEHQVGDLVATFEAGMTLSRAQELVGETGQRLPLSAPWPLRATLGGIVAAASEGPDWKAYGPVRDQILGLDVVHGDGRLAKAGGRVVKSVTGYDLPRLYCGSRGVLGVVTKITFRLRSLEPCRKVLLLFFEDLKSALAAGQDLRLELPELHALHLWGGSKLAELPPGPGQAALLLSLRGRPELVEALRESCVANNRGALSNLVLEGADLPDLQTPFPLSWRRARAFGLPAGLGELLQKAQGALLQAAPRACGLHADLERGLVLLGFEGQAPLPEQALALETHGFEAISNPRVPPRRKKEMKSTPEGQLMGRLMEALDPAGILNPGRFEAGP